MRCLVYPLLAALVAACTPPTVHAPVGDRSQRPAHIPATHVVRQGDTLYSVAFMYGYDVQQLARWNGLAPPYTIYKGQRLRLRPPPAPAAAPSQPKPRPAQARVSPSRPKPQTVAPSLPKVATAPVKAAPATPRRSSPDRKKPTANRTLRWSWPVDGPLLQRFDAVRNGRKGIDIGGTLGQPVHAAAAGKVVYSGSGLAGYGRLIIIKHSNDYLSAYAHNRQLLAREGEWVAQDQVIARMGSSGTDRVQLHFEIRRQGRPVDPLQFLPAR